MPVSRALGDAMRRREFISLLGGAAAWPLTARAQQGERMRRIGVLMDLAENDPEGQVRIAAFLQGLAQLGWTDGRNVRIDTRWGAGDADRSRRQAAELIALAPDVILATGTPSLGPLHQVTRTVPIVFVNVVDPVGGGFVDSLARPGGNATGFMSYEYSLSGKWLELLKQIAPGVTRVAVLRNSAQSSNTSQFAVIQAVAPSFRVDVNPINMRDAGEIEHAVAAFARAPNGGLIVTAGPAAALHRDLSIMLAQAARGLLRAFLRRGWRPDLLWAKFHRPIPSRRRLRGPHPQGRETSRPAGAGADQIRNSAEPQDRQGSRPRRANDVLACADEVIE